MSNVVLRIDGLAKYYGDFNAVDHISFAIQKGEVLGLLGPNGAGKSSTIQMLLGLLTPSAGTINYFGKDFARHRLEVLQRINYLSAYNTLQHRNTVVQNLKVFATLYNVKHADAKIRELLEYFGVGHLIEQRYDSLSAGQRTRVNLAKCFLNEPELILMDEPTASLDPDIVDKVLSMIERLKAERQLSLLFTSHNMQEVERVCDRVIFMSKGQIVKEAKTADLPSLHKLFIDIARQGDEG